MSWMEAELGGGGSSSHVAGDGRSARELRPGEFVEGEGVCRCCEGQQKEGEQ